MTPKQAAFVREYLIDTNATEAAIRAGYKRSRARQTGSRLVTNGDISKAIAEASKPHAAKLDLTAEWILTTLKAEAEDHSEGSSHGARVKALELLGRRFNLFPHRVDVKGDLTAKLVVVEEIVDADDARKAGEAASRPSSLPT